MVRALVHRDPRQRVLCRHFKNWAVVLQSHMLLFRQRPDVVFSDIVREALAWIAENLNANETDPHVMSTLLPRVAARGTANGMRQCSGVRARAGASPNP